MKILVAAPGFDEGKEHSVCIFAMDQARALRAAGHEVRVAAMDTRSALHRRRWGFYSYALDGLTVYYGTVPCGGLPGGWQERAGTAAVKGISRLMERDGWTPDIVHQHFGTDFYPLAGKYAVPFVITEHSSHHNRLMGEKEAAQLKKTYDRADARIAVSSALAEVMKKNTGLSAAVIPNIVDTEAFACVRESHEGFRFVTAGNLIPSKNMDSLIRAFARLRQKDALLTIFGEGSERQRLDALCRELNVQERVVFRGHCSRRELAEEYARSDCFVLPSASETFGVAYIEAMASGLPVIASRCGGPEDFVNGDNGLLIPVSDEAALQSAMEYMTLHASEYNGEAISASVIRSYAPETIAGMLTKLYEEVIA